MEKTDTFVEALLKGGVQRVLINPTLVSKENIRGTCQQLVFTVTLNHVSVSTFEGAELFPVVGCSAVKLEPFDASQNVVLSLEDELWCLCSRGTLR